ncbi:MAG: hypothetical protein ACOYVJ_02325 [Nitrospirota bacterium]
MVQPTKKVNFMIQEDIRKEFENLVPSGERSKVVNRALRKELMTIKRQRLTEKLMALRAVQPLATGEIVKALREDRKRTPQ